MYEYINEEQIVTITFVNVMSPINDKVSIALALDLQPHGGHIVELVGECLGYVIAMTIPLKAKTIYVNGSPNVALEI